MKKVKASLLLSVMLAVFLSLGACSNNDDNPKDKNDEKMEDMDNMENMDMDSDDGK